MLHDGCSRNSGGQEGELRVEVGRTKSERGRVREREREREKKKNDFFSREKKRK